MSMARRYTKRPEIWGGIECSFNCVNGDYMDQLAYAGHYGRIEKDIERIASLGIKTIRYPVIWERLRPEKNGTTLWSEADTALNALQRSGMTLVAGLVHHGSGPSYASLLSPDYAVELSSFARAVAERYPWIRYYTPVNEPLTTARFSALYGHWYPHCRSDRDFATALVNQMKGVVLSMQQIRMVNPDAMLLQTEDLAKVYGTPKLQYQVDFENDRRWLTWDILCGKVTPDHPLWSYLASAGVREEDLGFFLENPCPPDIIGVDYYATSERYIDEAVEHYPEHTHGSNQFERYADVEAIRVPHDQPSGIGILLMECWERYQRPIAIAEAHIGCDFDNQIRWFAEIRKVCMHLLNQQVDIRAVTAWSMLGAFGWNTLLTRPDGDYESGVFDVTSGVAVPTPLAEYLATIISNPDYTHPSEGQLGWWHNNDRFVRPPLVMSLSANDEY